MSTKIEILRNALAVISTNKRDDTGVSPLSIEGAHEIGCALGYNRQANIAQEALDAPCDPDPEADLRSEIKALEDDITSYVSITSELATDNEIMRAGLEKIAAQKGELSGAPLQGDQIAQDVYNEMAGVAQDALDEAENAKPDPVRNAAPEMLEALRGIDALWSNDFPAGPEKYSVFMSAENRKIWIKARHAIARAEGKS